jgi:hypothetical protein
MTNERNNPLHAVPHWSEARLLDRLYGLDPPPGLSEAHLDSCPDCAARWTALQTSRAALIAQPAPAFAEDRLRAQRIAVFNRIERPRGIWALAPAAATALLVVMGIALQTSPPVREPQTVAVISQSDRELFGEIAALMEEDAPRATDPFRGLFDANSNQEVQ